MTSMHASRQMLLSRENIELKANSGRGMGLMALGAICVVVTFVMSLMGNEENHMTSVALHAFQVGMLVTIGFSTAALGATMIFHQFNAGWMGAMRRQFENVMSLVWVGALMFIISLVMQAIAASSQHVYLFHWMEMWADPSHRTELYEHKSGFLNLPFFLIRALFYFAVWFGLTRLLWSYSIKQDQDGDRWHSAHARKLSAPGIVLWGFTVAFAGFDWLMALDYHWFSTMLGVYFFAGNMLSMWALTALIFVSLRSVGRLSGVYTNEHLHDHGKLMFAFVVFWAYITFSQYFLIWYANIPEETTFFIIRKADGTLWQTLSWVIPIGHFIAPFVILMARPAKRSFKLIAVMAIFLIGMHIIDLYWMVRPQAGLELPAFTWLDVVGIAGPVLFFAGALVRKIGSGPLVGIHDPRLEEALHHKNYV
ncbi:MAG: hypothetical protein KDA21_02850 [Phycisphaerales bacterium]|nr:hypothetical protein [Phycisphaerales bacterium]